MKTVFVLIFILVLAGSVYAQQQYTPPAQQYNPPPQQNTLSPSMPNQLLPSSNMGPSYPVDSRTGQRFDPRDTSMSPPPGSPPYHGFGGNMN
jgi:hypothetical protein